MDEQKGHGIPDSLLKEVKELTRKFFALPYEEKIKIKMSPAKGYRFLWNSFVDLKFAKDCCYDDLQYNPVVFVLTSHLSSLCRGYQRIGENITKGVPDIHEAIDVGFTTHRCFQYPIISALHMLDQHTWHVVLRFFIILICYLLVFILIVGTSLLFVVILIVGTTLLQCYKELKPGDYGDLGKTMEGCNQWYVKVPHLPPNRMILYLLSSNSLFILNSIFCAVNFKIFD